MVATSGQVVQLQQALFQQGAWPGVIGTPTGMLDATTVAQLDAYWAGKGLNLPANALQVQAMLAASFPGLPANSVAALSIDYVGLKGLPGAADIVAVPPKSWFGKNWKLLIGGTAAAAVLLGGGWWLWKQSNKPMQGLGGFGDMGCGCGLGHSGRTSTYSFPSGKKYGHYRDSTGRFHSHAR